jgi:hypothetical protein
VLAGYTVKFKVDGVSVGDGVTNTTGRASYVYTLPESLGDHTLTAEFDGDATYSPTDQSAVLTVLFADTTVTVTNKTAQAGDTINLVANLDRIGDGGLAGRTLVFSVGGQQIGSAVTNSAGRAVIAYTLPLQVGSLPIAVSFAGDAFYGASARSSQIDITQAATQLVVQDRTVRVGRTVPLRARLHRISDGVFITGATVQFSIDGVVIGSGVTDSGGYAYLLYTPIATGTYIVGADYAGDSVNAASTDVGTLTVSP